MYWPRTASWVTGHSKKFRQHEVTTVKRGKTNLPLWTCYISKQIMNSLVTGMSIESLQASWVSASLACNQVPDSVLGKIVQFMWHVKQQTVQVQHTFPLCHWNKQLVSDCHWSNTLEQYYIQIWPIFMHRILFGDVFKFYKFLFWLSVFSNILSSIPENSPYSPLLPI